MPYAINFTRTTWDPYLENLGLSESKVDEIELISTLATAVAIVYFGILNLLIIFPNALEFIPGYGFGSCDLIYFKTVDG